jgi:hypothetical protein
MFTGRENRPRNKLTQSPNYFPKVCSPIRRNVHNRFMGFKQHKSASSLIPALIRNEPGPYPKKGRPPTPLCPSYENNRVTG